MTDNRNFEGTNGTQGVQGNVARRRHAVGASATFAALVLSLGLTAGGPVPAAHADGSASKAVSSSRSFPGTDSVRRNLFADGQTASVTVDGDWGGVEKLDVPKTKSAEEKRLEAEQKAREEAERQAREREQAAAASRSASRTATAPDAGQAPAVAAPTSKNGPAVVQYALQFQGVPYVSGGNTPAGWDCSGFTQYVFAQFGVQLPHQSEAQRAYGTRVSDPQPGDLMWKPGHVGIYVGNGMMIHATKPGDVTRVASISWYRGWQYYRIV